MFQQQTDLVKLNKFLSGFNDVGADASLFSSGYMAMEGVGGLSLYHGYGSYLFVVKCYEREGEHFVFPEIGQGGFNLLHKVLSEIKSQATSVWLKQFTLTGIKAFQQYLGEVSYSSVKEIANSNLDCSKNSVVLENFAEHKNQAEYKMISGEDDLKKLRYILKNWEANNILEGESTVKTKYYERLFNFSLQYSSLYDGIIFYKNELPTGLVIWDKSLKDKAIVLANISIANDKTVYEEQLSQAFKVMRKQGARECELFCKLNSDYVAKLSETRRMDFHTAEVKFKELSVQTIIE